MASIAKGIGRVLKWVGIGVAALAVVVLVGGYFLLRIVVEPDAEKFGTVKDEAMQVGLTRADFPGAADPYFVAMDKGLLAEPEIGPDGGKVYPPEILEIAELLGLGPDEVRRRAIRGQNAWIVWTGGNDRFWDWAARNTAGSFDLLKLVSTHKAQYPGRHNRWRWLGLVNEPCFTAATGPDPKHFDLWLDQRDETCPPDPFAVEADYPGVKIGARGSDVLPVVGSHYGEPTGVIGLRLFPNPDFDADAKAAWDAERYYTDPSYFNRGDLVRPYRVGMSCAFCHVGPDPTKPPADPENPEWENLTSNPGAQYYWVERIFYWNTRPRPDARTPAPNEGNFLYQLFHTNPPGTLDTSLVSTDYMNNPRTMNAVYSVLPRQLLTRRWGREQLTGGELDNKQFQDYPETAALADFFDPQSGRVHTMRVLKDGADSVGTLGALNRVYLNIGLFSEEWLLHFRPFIGGQKISPIRIADAQKNSAYWGATEDVTADMAIFFLVTARPDRLADAPGHEKHLKDIDDPQVERGKRVFADTCARCHSSKIPKPPAESGVETGICADGGNGPNYRQCWDRYFAWTETEDFKDKMRAMVLARDPDTGRETFLDENYLSIDRRVPVDLTQTNACSPLATNGLEGDIWDNFTSRSYKDLPPANELTVYHPVSGGASPLQPRGNGRGYVRPASLISLWSSAPYLLNNAVGHVPYEEGYSEEGYSEGGYSEGGYPEEDGGTGYGQSYAYGRCPGRSDRDPYLPCVDNRMRVFDDSIRKMLWPEQRRMDALTAAPVPGSQYRTSAPSCVLVPASYLPDIVQSVGRTLYWLGVDWAFDAEGGLRLGPLPAGFPINTLTNTQLLPDNDQSNWLGHGWDFLMATPTLLGAFKAMGGRCSAQELVDPATQVQAEAAVRESGLIDTLVGLSKCPDYVVNRGHTFGAELSEADKEALIEYLKHF